MLLDVEKLTCGYNGREVVHEASLQIEPGQVVCLLGPNGSGKTTFFKTILGFLKPLGGRRQLDGRDLASMSRRELARVVAYVPQAHTPSFPFSVLDVVTMGRTVHMGMFASPSRADVQAAHEALDAVGVEHLADKPYTEISGGERQMSIIARVLTQQARLLIMDEPTSSLDFGNQARVLSMLRRLSSRGLGLLFTTHIPGHALLCADRVAIMHNGTISKNGVPAHVITEQSLEQLYGVQTRIMCGSKPGESSLSACVPMLN